MNDDDSLRYGCNVDGTGNSAFALHAHFPKWALQMLQIGLAHAFKAMRLNQFHNALKAGSNIRRKVIKRLSDVFVQEFKNSTGRAISQNRTFFAIWTGWPTNKVAAEYGAGPRGGEGGREREIDGGEFRVVRVTFRLEDVKKLKNKRGVNSASKTIAPGCPISDYWRGGIHFTPN